MWLSQSGAVCASRPEIAWQLKLLGMQHAKDLAVTKRQRPSCFTAVTFLAS